MVTRSSTHKRPASLGRRVLPAVVIAGASGALLVQLDKPAALAGRPARAAGGTTSGGAASTRTTTSNGGRSSGGSAAGGAVAGGASSGASLPARPPTQPSPTTRPSTTPTTRPAGVGGASNPDDHGFGPGGDDGGAPPSTVAPGQFPPRRQPGQRPQPGQVGAGGATVTNPPATAVPGCVGDATDGPVVDTRWGPVQVTATVSADGALCDVKASQVPNSHRRSVQINNFAVPVLHDRALAAQGANFNVVSGATITSDAYAESLQSILDHR